MVHVCGQKFQICDPFFICYSIPWLMCLSAIFHVLQAVAFELCQTRLLDGMIGSQLKNDYAVMQGESSSKLLFSLFRQPGSTLPSNLQAESWTTKWLREHISSCIIVALPFMESRTSPCRSPYTSRKWLRHSHRPVVLQNRWLVLQRVEHQVLIVEVL
jgi:hypothetical protein